MTTTAPCPICGKAVKAEFNPFCSSRCATLDLGRWLGEEYRLPASPDPEDGEESPNMRPDDERG